jgi:glycosyltransferase involved in cell wall biosynthesis
LANDLRLENISFLPVVHLNDLANEIESADICLGGPFGNTGKAARVVPGKIYQILAMQRPLSAARTPANMELLSHEQNAYLCEPDSPDALASAILRLKRDSFLRERIATAGRATFLERCSEAGDREFEPVVKP